MLNFTTAAVLEKVGGDTSPRFPAWLDEEELAERFFCEVAALIRVHEIFGETLENEEN